VLNPAAMNLSNTFLPIYQFSGFAPWFFLVLPICTSPGCASYYAFFTLLCGRVDPTEAPFGMFMPTDFMCSPLKRFGFGEVASSNSASPFPKTLNEKGKLGK